MDPYAKRKSPLTNLDHRRIVQRTVRDRASAANLGIPGSDGPRERREREARNA